MKETFAIISAVLVIVANISYSLDIIIGRVKPHSYTWFVWSVVNGIVLGGQFVSGAGVGALPTLVNEILTLVNFLRSLKYGYRAITWIDTGFLVIAIAGIMIWLATNDAKYSVILAVAIDLTAFVPTLRKAWTDPKTETKLLYGANLVRHVFALLSLEAYNVATALHSIAMLVTNSLMTGILIFRQK